MSEDVNDKGVEGETAEASAAAGGSIFEVFEPPPEIDPNRFGPVPVVPDADDSDFDDSELEDELAASDGESISAIFGFDPIPEERPLAAASSRPAHSSAASQDNDLGEVDGADEVDPLDVVAAAEKPVSETDLPHWTEPPTGLVPQVIAGDGESTRSDVGGPRWHGEGPQWAGDDLEAIFADEDGVKGPRRVSIEDDEDAPTIPSAAGAPQRMAPATTQAGSTSASHRPQVDSGERDLVQAVMFGVLLAGLAALAFWAGSITSVLLIAVAAGLAAGELYEAMRKAGLHPATLLGITAAVALPLAAYNRGEAGFTLVIGMAVIFGALWYLVGADNHRPALNLGLTMLGIAWVGGMAGFGALLVRADQIAVLVAAVIITVASDTGAYIGGRALGTRPFHPASPNKTWEGTIVGFIAAVVAGFVVGLLGLSVFSDNLFQAILLGVVVGIMAPIGDLTESLVKRDLGVKDMGTLIPGHGGILDRLDGLLFALPAAYYLGRVLDLF